MKSNQLASIIKEQYKVEPLKRNLSSATADRIFGKKKARIFSFDNLLYVIAALVCMAGLSYCFIQFQQLPKLPVLLLVLIPAVFYLSLSLKEIQVVSRSARSGATLAA